MVVLVGRVEGGREKQPLAGGAGRGQERNEALNCCTSP